MSILSFCKHRAGVVFVLGAGIVAFLPGCANNDNPTVTEASRQILRDSSPSSVHSVLVPAKASATVHPSSANKSVTDSIVESLASYKVAFEDVRLEANANHAKWFGRGSLRSNPERLCAGLNQLFEKHLPSTDFRGRKMTGTERKELRSALLENIPECGKERSMNVFPAMPRASAVMRANAADDASDWVNANITADWALGETPPAVGDLNVMVDSWVAADGTLQSIFALQANGHGKDIRAAAYAGCASMVVSNLGVIRTAALEGFALGGPIGAFGNGAVMTMVLCTGGGIVAGLAAYIAYK